MRIEIIGAGTVGRAVGEAFVAQGHDVRWIDTDRATLARLERDGLRATAPEEAVPAADASFLCVPTPTVGGEADYAAMRDAVRALGERIRRSHGHRLVVVKSTVLPGTTHDVIVPALEAASGRTTGADLGVCVCPEYLREKTAREDALHPRVIVIGADDRDAGDRLEALLAPFDAPVRRMSVRAAEFQKLVHNVFNAVKISFFNEMRRTGASCAPEMAAVFEATTVSAEGMWNPVYGTRDWGPFGLSCLPKDVAAFHAWAAAAGFDVPIVRAAMDGNGGGAPEDDRGGAGS